MKPLANRPPTLLIISQVFIPDPASVGQHVGDVAIEMARRGCRVLVYTSRNGYENPQIKYPPRENIQGVEVRRLPLASFGKKNIATRVFGTAMFMIQAFIAAMFTPGVDGIFFSTSPPLIGIVMAIAGMLRGIPVAYWAMDLNPDQLIAMGKLTPRSIPARILEGGNRFILRRSRLIIALDRFMAQRLRSRFALQDRMSVIPPWPHEDHLQHVSQTQNPFRVRNALVGKFVIMYSGNHSIAHPLTTLLQAAVHFKNDPDIRFLFVGGGLAKKDVDAAIREHALTNVLSLPYQPLAELGHSLSAADVHVVVMGDNMVGIVHPCKIYGAMAIGRPILFFGPQPSHVSDLLDAHRIGWRVAHGDVAGAIAAIQTIRATPPAELADMGHEAQRVLGAKMSQPLLRGQVCDRLEQLLLTRPAATH